MTNKKSITKIIHLLILLFVTIQSNAQDAEIKYNKDAIMPMVRLDPFPSSGVVKINSPNFVWAPIIKEKTGFNSYKWDNNYKYKIRISKDVSFQDDSTINSELQDWTFFIPHKKLEKGNWYWQYASVNNNSGEENWSKPIIFKITGNERIFVTPTPDEFIKRIPQSHPRFLTTKEEIGNMNFPEKEKNKFLRSCDKLIGKKLPESLIYNDRKVLDKKEKELSTKNYIRYINKTTKEIYKPQSALAINFIKAYFITGDEKYKKESLRRYFYLKDQYFDIVEKGFVNDFTSGFFLNNSINIYDAFYDSLDKELLKSIEERIVKDQKKTYHHFLHNSELDLMSSHRWQHHMRNFFTTSIILLDHVPEAEKWVKYVYDLWTLRSPTGSGDDGAWVAGNGYMGANIESLFVMPYLLSKYSGVNYFETPWYQNVSSYLFYTAPVDHIAGGFGDHAETKRTPTVPLVDALNAVKADKYGDEYVKLVAKFTPKYLKSRKNIKKGGNLFWFQNQPFNFDKGIANNESIKKAKLFRDAGIVAMHTNIEEPKENLMVAFKSSPYGITGHAHASQNTFNIQYGGDPLFFRTGYYSSWADHHSLQSYRHTRAQNGILANGSGTLYFSEGYGWIPRFIDGKDITYVSGDASNAYDGIILRDEYIEQCKIWKVDMTPENGFGNPGVTKFRRHLVLLRPNVIVIYDVLEAKQPVEWSWLIHSIDTLSEKANTFYTENKNGKGLLTLFSSDDVESSVTDQFYAPAVDWLGNGSKKEIEYTNHWHGKSDTKKTDKARFLAVIQIVDKESKTEFVPIEKNKDGKYIIGDWEISAQLDCDKETALQIINKTKSSGISLGSQPLSIDGKEYKHTIQGSTILIEDNGEISKEAVDVLPDAAIYY